MLSLESNATVIEPVGLPTLMKPYSCLMTEHHKHQLITFSKFFQPKSVSLFLTHLPQSESFLTLCRIFHSHPTSQFSVFCSDMYLVGLTIYQTGISKDVPRLFATFVITPQRDPTNDDTARNAAVVRWELSDSRFICHPTSNRAASCLLS